MKELLEFLKEKCEKGLDEAKGNSVDPRLTAELGRIQSILKKFSSSKPVEMKDQLYDLISTLTDINISHTHSRPAQIICSPLQIRSRRNTRKRLRGIRTELKKQLPPGTTESSPHGKEGDGQRQISKIMTTLKQLLTKKNLPNQNGEDGAGPEPHGQGTNDSSSNEEKEVCSGPEALQKIEWGNIKGFDDRVDKIKRCLNVQTRRGHIQIGIAGMCGSGKTTLAQLVYESVGEEEFKPKIWVNLPHKLTSNDTYFKQILEVILKQCGEVKGDQIQRGEGEDKGDQIQRGEGEDDLAQCKKLLRTIRNRLLGESYLLVLDGVWDTDMDWYFELGKALDWHYKEGDFGNDGSKSAVIITTRMEEAAKTMVGISALHHMDPHLTQDNTCWFIFINRVEQEWKEWKITENHPISFKKLKDDMQKLKDDMQKLKDDIEEQCEGLPLAAVALAKIISELIHPQQEGGGGDAAEAGSSVNISV